MTSQILKSYQAFFLHDQKVKQNIKYLKNEDKFLVQKKNV